jgi:hypothetical protein
MKQTFLSLEDQPALLHQGEWNFHALTDTALGVSITVVRGDIKIDIMFYQPTAYRCYLEEAQSSFWLEFHKNKSGTGLAYLASHSDWINSFKKEDLIHHKDVNHFLIVTTEKKIDIISDEAPKFLDFK